MLPDTAVATDGRGRGFVIRKKGKWVFELSGDHGRVHKQVNPCCRSHQAKVRPKT